MVKKFKNTVPWTYVISDLNDISDPNYTTKPDLKYTAGVNISKFGTVDDIANLKLEVDKLNIGETTQTD